MKRTILTAALLLVAGGATAQNPPDPQAQKAQALTADLFIAIRDHDVNGVTSALNAGADPNSRNWLGFTALMWAASRGDQGIVEALIARGAKINDASLYGSPTTFAAIGRSGKTAQYLLARGAAPNGKRLDGASILMLAAANNDAQLIAKLLARKADPNEQDKDGATALIFAARLGHDAAVKSLLKAGAKVDMVDSHGRSALSYAAANGHPATIALLLAKRAAVNLRDKQGATPLLLAARYNGDRAVIQSLIRAGANTSLRDSRGKTASELARSREFTAAASLLDAPGAKHVTLENPPAGSVRKAAQNSLNLIQTGMADFVKRAECSSCHHQGLALTAVLNGKKNGYRVDEALIGRYMQQLGKDGQEMGPAIHQALANPQIGRMIPAIDIGDFAVGAGYMFGSLVAAGVPANPGLAEAAQFLATLQEPAGCWSHGFERGHMQSSRLTTTALVLQILSVYGAHDQLKPAFDRARQWLIAARGAHGAEFASRVLGLKWAGAEADEIAKAVSELLAAQRPDGGWSSSPKGRSDAYATGLALCALHQAGGMAVGNPVYQRGVSYLVRTQDEDGSWYVTKTAMPANNHFDAGFPHGESQYASLAATSWAAMALMPAAETPQSARK